MKQEQLEIIGTCKSSMNVLNLMYLMEITSLKTQKI